MITDAPNINHLWAQLIVEEFVRNGITMFCLAPGSRSTPLTTAVARHPDAQSIVHVDERSTAFFATGYARSAGKPAVWITTSGTAVANGLPAAVEAFTDHLPLILLTADRPPERRGTGANQTIDQVKIFGDYVRDFFDLPVPDASFDPAMVLTTIDRSLHHARTHPSGPVHLNCMFRKPLAPDREPFDEPPIKDRLREWFRADTPYTHHPPPHIRISAPAVEETSAQLENSRHPLLVAGRLKRREQGLAIQQLAKKLQAPLVVDIASQIRLSSPTSPAIPYSDRLLAETRFRSNLQPDIVLQFGARCTSKHLRTFLSDYPPDHRIVVKEYPERFDIDHSVDQSFEADIVDFCRRLSDAISADRDEDWLSDWTSASQAVAAVFDRYLSVSSRLTEPRVARLLTREIPSGHGLFLASSRPIRDVDTYGMPNAGHKPIGANRGASGIDGTLSSATGFARGLDRPVTLLCGDLALLHDLNALAIVRESPQPISIVTVNNNGGGIFSFLPIEQHKDVFEEFFATPFDVTFDQAAEMFDLPYEQPTTIDTFVSAYRKHLTANQSCLIEVCTNRANNRKEHERIEKKISDALTSL